MPLTTYSELKTEIASNIARSGITSASSEIDTFIDQAEAYINKKLRNWRMEDDDTVTTVANTATANLPTDFLEVIVLEHNDDPKVIEFRPRSTFPRVNIGQGGTGRPKFWTLRWDKDNSRAVAQFASVPDAIYTLPLAYYSRIPALSDSQTTTWLLDDYPDIYLNGALYYAFRRYRNPLSGDYKALLDSDITMLNEENEKTNQGDASSRQRVLGTIV